MEKNMILSTHKVEVVPVTLEEHPNADKLSVVNVFGGYPCCVRTADWKNRDLAAYIPPDSVVDVTRSEFSFLAKGTKTKHRVKCVKLRGVQSYGLLVPAPEGAQIGDDVAEYFGVEHYEPVMRELCTGGEAESAPERLRMVSKYDLDSLRRYASVFEPGEPVMVTEKIHGANSRYCYWEDRMWCGSRREWKRQDSCCLWWNALTDEMAAFCRTYPGVVLFGEIYGNVQSLKYGHVNEARFAAFDVLDSVGLFIHACRTRTLLKDNGVPQVPLLDIVPFDFDAVCAMAEGPSKMPKADHIREGCVVKPLVERFHQSVGRVCLKVVGAGYLEKS